MARSPAASGVSIDSQPANTKSGSRSSTASWLGAKSEITGMLAASAAYSAGTGPSWNADPTIRSPRPRANSSSVLVDLIVTMRCGADAGTSTAVPQLSMVTGCVSAASVVVGGGLEAHPARLSAMTARMAVGAKRTRISGMSGGMPDADAIRQNLPKLQKAHEMRRRPRCSRGCERDARWPRVLTSEITSPHHIRRRGCYRS